jgi:hypothetical protein
MLLEIDIPDDIYEFATSDQYQSRRSLQEKFKISEMQARIYVHLLRISNKILTGNRQADEHRTTEEYKDNSGMLEVNSYTIHTLEGALDAANVDLEKWKVERWVCNSWQVTMKIRTVTGADKDGNPTYEDVPTTKTNYQVKVWLKPKISQPLEIALRKIIEEIPTFKFNRVPRFTAESGIAGEMALLDAHFGKLAWARETGRRDYNLKAAVADYTAACDQNLQYMEPHKPEKIFFIVGQDLMHIENMEGTTPKGGNVLDYDTRLPKIFKTALETVIKCVYRCRDVAPVEVIWVPGNHDMHASMFLCCALEQHFRNDEHVTVDVSEEYRKARLWGNLLIGWTHELPVGRATNWANELAHAFPKLWGQSEYREWHHGHKHKKSQIKISPVSSMGGVTMRQLTALSPIDFWHYEHMFVDAIPGGESFILSKDHGVVANYVAWSKTKNIRNS